MPNPINIHSKNAEIYLQPGIYGITALGGSNARVGNFSISLINTKSGQIVEAQNTMWRSRFFRGKRHGVRILTIDIADQGNYRVTFKNPESLQVIRHYELFLRLFFKSPENKDIEICIGPC
ncbi:MAG: hypothetical protein AAFP76_11370 [Bacteroidota bacterium]